MLSCKEHTGAQGSPEPPNRVDRVHKRVDAHPASLGQVLRQPVLEVRGAGGARLHQRPLRAELLARLQGCVHAYW